MKVVKAAFFYFALVFGAGFVLEPVRVLWAVPRFETRAAELMEMPIMLVITIVAARWVIRRLGVPPTVRSRLGLGCSASSRSCRFSWPILIDRFTEKRDESWT